MISDTDNKETTKTSTENTLFTDIFNLEEIQQKQDLFSDATGVGSIITNHEGTPITRPSNYHGLIKNLIDTSETMNACAGITIGDKHSANWIIVLEKNEDAQEKRLIQFEKVSKLLFSLASELTEKGNNHLLLKKQISARRKDAELLLESEAKYKRLIDTMPNGFYRTTPEGYYVDANHAMVKMLGYASKEELFKVYIPTGIYVRSVERDVFKRTNEDFVHNFEVYRLKTKDGRIIWIEDNARYLKDESGQVIYNEGICRDITDRMVAEAEIKFQNEELLKLNAEKDKFFSIIAHDLRSPFNSFLGLTQIMAEELPGLTMDEIQKFAVSMRNSASNLFRLLENLLQWSRIQQGLIPFDQEFVELLPVIDESIEMMLEHVKSKNIEIIKIIPSHLKIYADTNILHAVLRNLISNAVKFTAKGGKITISAKAFGGKYVEIAIMDSGIGMSPAMVHNLFRLDVQTTRKGTDDEPSTGLGLFLCKDFIEKHGGKLWVESEESKGSVFYFTIPY